MVREFGMVMFTLLCLEWVTNKDFWSLLKLKSIASVTP